MPVVPADVPADHALQDERQRGGHPADQVRPDEVRAYYDAHIHGKLRGFVDGNARVECAWSTIEEYAGEAPARILEIGCGIGDLSWRCSRRWPESQVVGLDVSPRSVRVARKLFGSARLTFCEGPLVRDRVNGPFDLIVLVDVYEHVAAADRPVLHDAIQDILDPDGRIILTCPTPRHLAWLRANMPNEIQPVDENISVDTISQLARDTGTEVLLYREVGVWREGDYTHAVLGSRREWSVTPKPVQSVRRLPPSPLVPSRTKRLAMVEKAVGTRQ